MTALAILLATAAILAAGWSIYETRAARRWVRALQIQREAGAPIPHTRPVPHRNDRTDREYASRQSRLDLVGVPKDPPPGGSGIGHVTRVWNPARHHDSTSTPVPYEPGPAV